MSKNVATAVTSAFDRAGTNLRAVGVGSVYLLLSVFSIVAIAQLSSANDTNTAANVGLFSVIVGVLVHAALQLLGTTLVKEFILYPVGPEWLFRLIDVLLAMLLVLAILSYLLVSSHVEGAQARRDALQPWLILANLLLIPCQFAYVYKAGAIVVGVRNETRSPITGEQTGSLLKL